MTFIVEKNIITARCDGFNGTKPCPATYPIRIDLNLPGAQTMKEAQTQMEAGGWDFRLIHDAWPGKMHCPVHRETPDRAIYEQLGDHLVPFGITWEWAESDDRGPDHLRVYTWNKTQVDVFIGGRQLAELAH